VLPNPLRTIPDPPRPLDFAALRLAVRERPGSLFFGLVAATIPFFQTVVFLMGFSSYLGAWRDPVIRSSGKATQGEVVRVEDAPGFSIDNVQPKRVFFHYQSEGIDRERSMVTLSVNKVAGWKPGQPVPVLYNDQGAIIDGIESPKLPVIAVVMMLAAAAWTLTSIPFLSYAFAGISRKYALLKNGIPRQGKLISFESLPTFPRTRSSLRSLLLVETLDSLALDRFLATYSYLDSSGRERIGKAPSRDLTLLKAKTKGDEITILVLPGDERRSTLLDAAAERVVGQA
jgi:hypothetical protein